MQMRDFGRTGMKVSALGFGCGAVGGIMVRGDPADQERLVARAIAVGVNYFDTAVLYGDGDTAVSVGPRTIFGALTALAGLFATLLGGAAGDRLRDRFSGSYFLVSGIALILGFPMVLGFLFSRKHNKNSSLLLLDFLRCHRQVGG